MGAPSSPTRAPPVTRSTPSVELTETGARALCRNVEIRGLHPAQEPPLRSLERSLAKTRKETWKETIQGKTWKEAGKEARKEAREEARKEARKEARQEARKEARKETWKEAREKARKRKETKQRLDFNIKLCFQLNDIVGGIQYSISLAK